MSRAEIQPAKTAPRFAREQPSVRRQMLIEAAIQLEAAPAALGEPMEIIPAVPTMVNPAAIQSEAWIAPGGPLPGLKTSGTVSPRACPRCDSRTTKTVRLVNKRMMLTCPVCGLEWPFQDRPT